MYVRISTARYKSAQASHDRPFSYSVGAIDSLNSTLLSCVTRHLLKKIQQQQQQQQLNDLC
jgi:hypothetical protein